MERGPIKSWGVDDLVTTFSDPGHVRVNGKVAGQDHGTLSPNLCWSGIVLLWKCIVRLFGQD